MSKSNPKKVKYDIYKERFSYKEVSKEAGCKGIVQKNSCPAIRVVSQGADHPLIALSQCAQCRREHNLTAYTKTNGKQL